MYIDRILSPVTTLGPGRRLVIWTKGCGKHCKGCANPELWHIGDARNRPVEEIVRIVTNIYRDAPFEGITISGGDPLEQKEEVLRLLKALTSLTEDILVYTGYTMAELEQSWSGEELAQLRESVAVVIDGPYVDALNEDGMALRGSGNQRIYYLKPQFQRAYEQYMEEGRKIQNIYMGSRLVSVGIHNRMGGLTNEEA